MADIGLIGTGYWGNILHKKLETLGNLRFVCSGRNFSDYIGNLSHVNWVFIATPNNTHYAITKKCISDGVNVFCEKPLTANFAKSKELYDLAKKRDARLYVDDVFLFRNETKNMLAKVSGDRANSIRFVNRKYGSFKDNIFNNLVYHDLSVLYSLFGNLDYTGLKFYESKLNRKEFEFFLGRTRVSFLYDRLSQERDKKTFVDEDLFDYNNPSNDALHDMLSGVLSETVDFDRNKAMCLSVDRFLEELNKIEEAHAKRHSYNTAS